MAKVNNLKSMDDAKKVATELHLHKVNIAEKEAALNKKIQELMENFDNETKGYVAYCAEAEKLLKNYCKKNPQLFKEKKTIQFDGIARMGYRLGNPKLNYVQAGATEAMVLNKVKKVLGEYVGSKEWIESRKILADYASGKLNDAMLAKGGLRVDQNQKFFVDVIMIKADENAQ